MAPDLSAVPLADVRQEVFRNIVSLRQSQNLFDDLSPDAGDWAQAQAAELAAKPPPYRSATPVLHRPFEDAAWFNAIGFPFTHWQTSRYSDGRHGVWYGSERLETTVHETVYHWVDGLLRDAGFEREEVVAERRIYTVACQAALLDLRPCRTQFAELFHPRDYRPAQALGARLHGEGHPGLIAPSVRDAEGSNLAVFNERVLSQPRQHCYLSYRYAGGNVRVEKTAGRTWLRVPAPTS